MQIKQYYILTKPGLVYGNLLTVAAGYLYGAGTSPNLLPLLAILTGSALIMAAGTTSNSVADRTMDKKMKRTKNRPLATGSITPIKALLFAATVGIIGIIILASLTNMLTALLGLIGFVTYAGVYTYLKPRTPHAALVGAIPGAIPIVSGYTAATDHVDVSFWILLLLLVAWQMVHFYAIALFRLNDYKDARVPVMPLAAGERHTLWYMIFFTAMYIVSVVALFVYGNAGIMFLTTMLAVSLWWLIAVIKALHTSKDALATAARSVFLKSLIVQIVFCASLIINAWANIIT